MLNRNTPLLAGSQAALTAVARLCSSSQNGVLKHRQAPKSRAEETDVTRALKKAATYFTASFNAASCLARPTNRALGNIGCALLRAVGPSLTPPKKDTQSAATQSTLRQERLIYGAKYAAQAFARAAITGATLGAMAMVTANAFAAAVVVGSELVAFHSTQKVVKTLHSHLSEEKAIATPDKSADDVTKTDPATRPEEKQKKD